MGPMGCAGKILAEASVAAALAVAEVLADLAAARPAAAEPVEGGNVVQ